MVHTYAHPFTHSNTHTNSQHKSPLHVHTPHRHIISTHTHTRTPTRTHTPTHTHIHTSCISLCEYTLMNVTLEVRAAGAPSFFGLVCVPVSLSLSLHVCIFIRKQGSWLRNNLSLFQLPATPPPPQTLTHTHTDTHTHSLWPGGFTALQPTQPRLPLQQH